MTQASSTAPSGDALLQSMRLRIASQMAPRNWVRPLEQLADRCANGSTFDEATHHDNWNAPAKLRALCSQAMAAQNPSDVVLKAVQRENQLRETWQGLFSSLLYPVALLSGSVIFLKILQMTFVNEESFQWLNEFGIKESPVVLQIVRDYQNLVDGIFLALIWCVVLALTVQYAASQLARFKIIGAIPVLGRPVRLLNLSRFLSRIQLFTEGSRPLITATQLASQSFEGEALQPIGDGVTQRLQNGGYLGFALHQSILSDTRTGAVLTLLDVNDSPIQDRLERSSRLLEAMVTQWNQRLQVILPTLLLLLVGSLLSNAISIYFAAFLIFVSLISSLA